MTSIEWLSEMVSKMGYVSADIVEQAKEMHNKEIMITDEEFVKLYNQIIRTQHLEGYKDLSTGYHLGFLHGLDYLFDYIKRQNDKTNG